MSTKKRVDQQRKQWQVREWTEEDAERLRERNRQRGTEHLRTKQQKQNLVVQHLGLKWFTNDEIEIQRLKCPEGFYAGRLKRSS